MDAYNEIEKIINASSSSDAKKAWLNLELLEMNEAKDTTAKVMKQVIKDHSDDPQIKMVAMMDSFKTKLVNRLKEEAEADELGTIANDIINKN